MSSKHSGKEVLFCGFLSCSVHNCSCPSSTVGTRTGTAEGKRKLTLRVVPPHCLLEQLLHRGGFQAVFCSQTLSLFSVHDSALPLLPAALYLGDYPPRQKALWALQSSGLRRGTALVNTAPKVPCLCIVSQIQGRRVKREEKQGKRTKMVFGCNGNFVATHLFMAEDSGGNKSPPFPFF